MTKNLFFILKKFERIFEQHNKSFRNIYYIVLHSKKKIKLSISSREFTDFYKNYELRCTRFFCN